MHSIKRQKYYVEGTAKIDISRLVGTGCYRRLTLRTDRIYVSLFIEYPKEGIDKKIVEQAFSGFYVAECSLLNVGQSYQICDALTKIGKVSVEGT